MYIKVTPCLPCPPENKPRLLNSSGDEAALTPKKIMLWLITYKTDDIF